MCTSLMNYPKWKHKLLILHWSYEPVNWYRVCIRTQAPNNDYWQYPNLFNILTRFFILLKRVQSKQTIKIEDSFKKKKPIWNEKWCFSKDNSSACIVLWLLYLYLYSKTTSSCIPFFSIDVIIVVQNDHHYNYPTVSVYDTIISGWSAHIVCY